MHTFIVHVQDRPGVLNRVVSLFRRRAYNIHDIHSSRTHLEGIHRMTIWAGGDAARIAANLYKLIDVIEVEEVSQRPFLARGLALLKIEADAPRRPEILQLCEVFRATPVDIGPDALIVELTGSAEKIASFVDVMRPFGIREMAQTAAVAMCRASGSAASRAEERAA